MTTKYIFVLNILKLAFAADIEVSKFKFIGYRNVWHTGQDHRVSSFQNQHYTNNKYHNNALIFDMSFHITYFDYDMV